MGNPENLMSCLVSLDYGAYFKPIGRIKMPTPKNDAQFSQTDLDRIFPPSRTDQFFEALFGDAKEGAYDISLVFKNKKEARIDFEFQLKQRTGKCLACNLTHGLPDVFKCHRVLNVAEVVRQIDAMIKNGKRCGEWQLGRTREISRELHAIPLTIDLIAE